VLFEVQEENLIVDELSYKAELTRVGLESFQVETDQGNITKAKRSDVKIFRAKRTCSSLFRFKRIFAPRDFSL